MVHLRYRLANYVRSRRGEATQRAFARKLGVAQSTIMRIENEDQNVTLQTLEQLCRAFRVDVADLFPTDLPVRHYSAAKNEPVSQPGQPAMIHEQPARTRRSDKAQSRQGVSEIKKKK